MAVTTQVIQDSETNFVVHVVGVAAAIAVAATIDVSALAANTLKGVPTELRLTQCKWTVMNHQATGNAPSHVTVAWDATANVVFLNLTEGQDVFDYRDIGGISNNAGAGKTGDVVITVSDQIADFTLTLYFRKRFA